MTAGPLRSHTQRPGVPPGEIASAPVSAQGPLPALSSGASTSPLRPRRLDGAADASCNALADGHPRGRERGPSIGTRPSPSISRSRSRLGSTSVLPALRLPAIDTASRAIPTPQHMEHYLEHELAQLQPAGKREPQGRWQAHRQCLAMFAAQFKSYAGPLDRILHECDAYIQHLKTTHQQVGTLLRDHGSGHPAPPLPSTHSHPYSPTTKFSIRAELLKL